MLLRFTPLGVEDVLEDVQRMYVRDSLRNLKVKNKTEDNEPVSKEYDVFIQGTTSLDDHHDSHQGSGLCLAVCTQCAAMLSKNPDLIDCHFVDNTIRIGTLVYESYLNANFDEKKYITSPQTFLDEHEHLRIALKMISEEHVKCPKRIAMMEYEEGVHTTDQKRGPGKETNDGPTKEEDEDEEDEHPFDEELERVVDGHVVQAETVHDKLMDLNKAAHLMQKKPTGRRDSSIRFSAAVSSLGNQSSGAGGAAGGAGGASAGAAGVGGGHSAKLAMKKVYMGIFCSDQLSLVVSCFVGPLFLIAVLCLTLVSPRVFSFVFSPLCFLLCIFSFVFSPLCYDRWLSFKANMVPMIRIWSLTPCGVMEKRMVRAFSKRTVRPCLILNTYNKSPILSLDVLQT